MIEKITIFSRQLYRPLNRGPTKVLRYALEGMRVLGFKLTINTYIPNRESIIWVHDDMVAAIYMHLRGVPALVGPNLITMPYELPKILQNGRSSLTHLVPCAWVKDLWDTAGGKNLSIKVWPVGIPPPAQIVDSPGRSNRDVLVYFKSRKTSLLDEVTETLKKHNLKASIFIYGNYQQGELQEAANRCSFGIWIAGTETQNIALLETLSYGLPLIVIDAISLGENVIETDNIFPQLGVSKQALAVRTTSAPYFDSRCGLKIDSTGELNDAIAFMKSKSILFDPVAFVVDKCDISISIRQLVNNQEKCTGFTWSLLHLFYLALARLIWVMWLATSVRTYRYLLWRLINGLKLKSKKILSLSFVR